MTCSPSAAKVSAEFAAAGVIPGLAVVLVGENPASQVYVGAKSKAAKACGFHSVQHNLPDSVDQATLLGLIKRLERRSRDPRHSRAIAAAQNDRRGKSA